MRNRAAIASGLCCVIAATGAIAALSAQAQTIVEPAGVVELLNSSETTLTAVQTGKAPLALNIPELGDADVVPVGVDEFGEVEVPEDVNVVGWYRFSAPIGAFSGRTVLVGHRDGRTQGRGFFFGVSRLGVGSSISVRTESGTTDYVVTGRATYERNDLPPELFTKKGPHELVLMSCAGSYIKGFGYESNVVIVAKPLQQP